MRRLSPGNCLLAFSYIPKLLGELWEIRFAGHFIASLLVDSSKQIGNRNGSISCDLHRDISYDMLGLLVKSNRLTKRNSSVCTVFDSVGNELLILFKHSSACIGSNSLESNLPPSRLSMASFSGYRGSRIVSRTSSQLGAPGMPSGGLTRARSRHNPCRATCPPSDLTGLGSAHDTPVR